MSTASPSLLTRAEVARELRVCVRTVDSLRAAGLLRPVAWPLRRTLYPRAEVERLARQLGGAR